MPCKFYSDKEGQTTMIVCSRGGRPKQKCSVCGGPVTALCDYPVAGGKTCDALLCKNCAQPVGPNKDFCPTHFDLHRAEQAGGVKRIEGKLPASWRQTTYIRALCEQTGTDADKYNFAQMGMSEATRIIGDLVEKQKRGEAAIEKARSIFGPTMTKLSDDR